MKPHSWGELDVAGRVCRPAEVRLKPRTQSLQLASTSRTEVHATESPTHEADSERVNGTPLSRGDKPSALRTTRPLKRARHGRRVTSPQGQNGVDDQSCAHGCRVRGYAANIACVTRVSTCEGNPASEVFSGPCEPKPAPPVGRNRPANRISVLSAELQHPRPFPNPLPEFA